jgi:hypothetical protein
MNVKLMLSGVLAASCTELIAFCDSIAPLSITLQQKKT